MHTNLLANTTFGSPVYAKKSNVKRRREYVSKKKRGAITAALARWNRQTDEPPDDVRSDPLERAPSESAMSLELSIPSASKPSASESNSSSETDSQRLPSNSAGHRLTL